jgi:hypothetical protein
MPADDGKHEAYLSSIKNCPYTVYSQLSILMNGKRCTYKWQTWMIQSLRMISKPQWLLNINIWNFKYAFRFVQLSRKPQDLWWEYKMCLIVSITFVSCSAKYLATYAWDTQRTRKSSCKVVVKTVWSKLQLNSIYNFL